MKLNIIINQAWKGLYILNEAMYTPSIQYTIEDKPTVGFALIENITDIAGTIISIGINIFKLIMPFICFQYSINNDEFIRRCTNDK